MIGLCGSFYISLRVLRVNHYNLTIRSVNRPGKLRHYAPGSGAEPAANFAPDKYSTTDPIREGASIRSIACAGAADRTAGRPDGERLI